MKKRHNPTGRNADPTAREALNNVMRKYERRRQQLTRDLEALGFEVYEL